MASNGTTTTCCAPEANGSAPHDSLRASPSKKRKSRIGSVFRRLFSRKSVKSQISAPKPVGSEDVPKEFLTSTLEDRYQRAVSLPVGEISRHSALGSHAPLEMADPEKEAQEEASVQRRPRRPRRATLPSVIGPTAESLVDSGYHEKGQSFLDDDQTISPSDIGFAVTSGSNPKRRSRSADAYITFRGPHRASSTQWRKHRRRSDEIKYWRTSVGLLPPSEHGGTEEESAHDDHNAPADETIEIGEHTAPVFLDDDDEEETKDKPELAEHDDRGTFDFGILASTIQQEENVSIEERMVTVEVKLMDLEYAISKLQANTNTINQPKPDFSSTEKDAPAETVSAEHTVQPAQGRRSPANSIRKSNVGSSSTTSGSLSTQPTTLSLAAHPLHLQQTDDPFVESKPRPTSDATTIRCQPNSPVLVDRSRPTSGSLQRSSLTSLTIDHFATLISLIRTEQAARHRLEGQVEELQREIKGLQQQTALTSPQQAQYTPRHSPASNSSFSRRRGWTSDPREGLSRGYGSVRSIPSYDDTTSTDDGFQDVYETPTEQRFEYEGGVINGVEGEAF